MKYRSLRSLSAGLLLAASTVSVHAGLIEADYAIAGDELAVYDDVTGLTWLDLSLTDEINFSQALTQYSGFRIATEAEVQDLLGNYFNVNLPTSNTSALSSTDFQQAALQFHDLFGDTWSNRYAMGRYIGDFDVIEWGGIDTFNTSHVWFNHSSGRSVGQDQSVYWQGIWMVSESAGVPAPLNLAVFGLGLIGLMIGRSRQSKNA